MADYMLPTNMAPLPAGLFDAFPADPGPFIDAMESGMQSFASAHSGGGMAAAGDAFMSTMHDHCAAGDVPGMTPETFDTFADAFTEIAGPGLMTMPADASAADVAEVFQNAAEIMMPEGVDMPPEMGPTKVHEMYSLFLDAGNAEVLVNGRPLKGKVVERDFAHTKKSTAFLAFSETWIDNS